MKLNRPKKLIFESGQQMRTVPFIIMADLRTGSTLISATLNTHPETKCLGELFHPEDLPDNCPAGINRFESSGHDLVRHVFDRRDVKAAGFKSMIFLPTSDQPQWADAWQALEEEPDLHVIILKRRNVLAQYASYLVARQTGKFHPSPEDPVLISRTRPRVEVKSRALDEWENERRQLFGRRMQPLRSKPTLEIEYADLVDSWERSIARIQNFLHLTPIKLKPAKSKQEQRALSDVIENYDHLKKLGIVE